MCLAPPAAHSPAGFDAQQAVLLLLKPASPLPRSPRNPRRRSLSPPMSTAAAPTAPAARRLASPHGDRGQQ